MAEHPDIETIQERWLKWGRATDGVGVDPDLSQAVSDALALADALEHSIAYAINRGADLRLERDAALARLAQAERERADWKRIVDQNLDANAVTVAELAADLAAARTALEKYGRHYGACPAQPVTRSGNWLNPPKIGACTCGFAAALAPPPTPCASRGQDPAGGHNLGCPDGAALAPL